MQSSFFDLDNRHKKLDERDKLVWLNKTIDWEAFRETLNKCRDKPRKSKVRIQKAIASSYNYRSLKFMVMKWVKKYQN